MYNKCSILQIVGFQNSGKTTLIEKLLKKSNQIGLVTATIKHHGHGGTPEVEITSKDSIRHLEAGAIVTSVEGEGVLQLRTNFINWNLEKTIELYRFFSTDLILIEGYKHENYPKVVLIRNEFDLQLLESLSNIKCIISHVPLENHRMKDYDIFHLNDDEHYVEFLMNEVVRKNVGGD